MARCSSPAGDRKADRALPGGPSVAIAVGLLTPGPWPPKPGWPVWGPLGHQDAIIMLGVLEIVLRHHPVAHGARIARKLQIFLIDVRRGAADLHVGPGRIESPVMIFAVAAVCRVRVNVSRLPLNSGFRVFRAAERTARAAHGNVPPHANLRCHVQTRFSLSPHARSFRPFIWFARSSELSCHEGRRFILRFLRLFRCAAAGTFVFPQWGEP